MQSKATTVEEYLSDLPPDRRAAISAVRDVIRANLDPAYSEGMSYGMIGYAIPHSVYPAGYHCDPRQPLPFACLAAQKNHLSLHLMSVYFGGDGERDTEYARWFRQAWAKTGKKLDMGKACIRFKRAEDLPLEVIGEAIRRVPAKTYIEWYETALAGRSAPKKKPAKATNPAKKKAATKTSAAKPPAAKKPAKKKPVAASSKSAAKKRRT